MRAAVVLILLGAVSTVAGVGMVYLPAAIILAGISTTGFGVLVAVGATRRSTR